MRPLSKERREYFAQRQQELQSKSATDLLVNYRSVSEEDVAAILEAEAYWREAVKGLDMMQFYFCPFCKKRTELIGVELVHRDDCPWKLAQD